MHRVAYVLLATVLLAACADSTEPSFGPPAALQIVSGNLQSDTVGQELSEPLVVRAVDAEGRPVQGQIINFRVIAGGGSVFAGVALTDTLGEARERWTLGTVAQDTQQVEARAVDTQTGEALVFGTFKAVGLPGQATSVAVLPATGVDSALFIGGDTLLTGDFVTFAAVAQDQHGNLKSGAVVWSSGDTALVAVSADGVAQAKAPGAASVVAAVDAVTGSTSFTIDLRVAVALELVGGAGQSDTTDATLPNPVEVRAIDRRGDGFEGAEITFRGENGAPTDTTAGCSCKVVPTDSVGVASTQWVLGLTAGEAALLMKGEPPGGGTVFDSLVVTATITHGAADNMSKVSGGGSTTGLIVAIRDRRGNPVSAVVVSWAITSGTGTLSDALSVSDINGLAGTSVSSATGTITVEATVAGLNGSPVTFTVSSTPNFALDFNQSYVNVPDNDALDLTTSWTLEAWVFPRAVGGTDQDIISKWNGGGNASYIMQIDRTGVLRVVTHDGANTVMLGQTVLAVNTWQHVAATFSNGTVNMYINGVLDQTFSNARTPMNSTQPVAFGREGNFSGGTLNGIIDEVRIWNIVRSGSDLATFRAQRLAGTDTGLVGYWRFDEGSGDVAFDATGNGNNGRLGTTVGVDTWDPQWTTNAAPIT